MTPARRRRRRANLHKAASYARRALGDRGAVVLRGGPVELAPAAELTTDVERFERGDDAAYGRELLPDERYEQWTLGPRARLRERRVAMLRSEGRWEDVLREDPADEEAHRALMRRHVAGGDRPAAARQFRLLLAEGDRRAAGEAPRRAAEGYAAACQLLNERRAREALERLPGAEIMG